MMYSGIVKKAGTFDPTARVKVCPIFQKWPKIFNAKKEEINYEHVQQNDTMEMLLEISPIYVSTNLVSAQFRLVQGMVTKIPIATEDEFDLFAFD